MNYKIILVFFPQIVHQRKSIIFFYSTQISNIICLQIIRCQFKASATPVLFLLNDQSRTCALGGLNKRWCTQLLQTGSLYLGRKTFLGEFVLVFPIFPYEIHIKCLHLRKKALDEALGISNIVVYYIFRYLQILNLLRAGHAAFLIPPTEIKLFLSALSPSVPKYSSLICPICTQASPSIDSILLLPKSRETRAVKCMWAIYFTTVAFLLLSTLSVTYITPVQSLRIKWCP